MSGCTVDGCTKTGTRIIRGMCEMHYRRWRAHGDPTIVVKPGRKTKDRGCDVDGCRAPHKALGMCVRHYLQHYHATKGTEDTTPWQVVCGDCGQHLGHVPHHGDPWQLFDRHTHRKVS